MFFLRNLILTTLLITLGAAHAFAATQCDEQREYTGFNGQALVDCRVIGDVAQARYYGLQAQEQMTRDADGGLAGFVKEDEYNYCFASAHRTSFECSQTLDAATGAVLPLRASVSASLERKQSCAMTNGLDVCSPTVACCDGSICNADASGIGLCD